MGGGGIMMGGMEEYNGQYVMVKFLENVIVSMVGFLIWVNVFNVWSYMIFGVVVAMKLAMRQMREIGWRWYILVGIGDMIFWPAMVVIDIRRGGK